MSTLAISIKDSEQTRTLKPVVTKVSEAAFMDCKNLMKMYKAKLSHEKCFANCTSDMVAHI